MTGRIVDRIRGRVVTGDNVTYSRGGQPWEDVLIVRRIEGGTVSVEVWGRAVQHPDAVPHPTEPQYVHLGDYPGDIVAMPKKGQQRLLTLEGVELTVHVLRLCCSAPFRDFRPS